MPQADIDNFRRAAGLSATKLTYVLHQLRRTARVRPESARKGDLDEADLDIEWSGGIAKNATVDYIYASAADQTPGGV